MKKILALMVIFTLLISCGDDDSEDFDPTRLDIVTGMNLTNDLGQIEAVWGNPNVSVTSSVAVFPKPAFGTIRIEATTSIKNIWIVRGVPSRRFTDTNFVQVFAENPFQQNEVEAISFKTFDNLNTNNIVLNISDISQGYYRIFVQLQDDSIISDNIYVEGTNGVNLDDINFWN